MTYIKWFFIICFWLIVVGFLHYTLPQTDIVRINDTVAKRERPADFPLFWSASNPPNEARDVFQIQATQTNGRVAVYRNEDTGWGWPPYFKFDTSNLQAEAADLRSTSANPQWVAIRHYGWRNEIFSIFPNAISVRPVDGPDVRIIPWFNIVILIVLAGLGWAIRVRWVRFWARKVDPALERVGDRLHGVR